ncbi:hypothetical protein MCUN1_000936 [Malassezia cuniculi]|uniref:Uncharacterized protein n=1 Tax=Malassezia cuniculi TaxID=948313 RepID=A0AAF0ES86_9BASI|nr:hypothetical protein MCUN1_000936 [Malassezia cuniculi]
MLSIRAALSRASVPRAFSRPLSTAVKPIAIAFDIDGVLKHGEHVLPEAHRAIQMLEGKNPWNRRVPYIFVTNGGGQSEDVRAQRLSKDLGVTVDPRQVVLSHTVMQSLVGSYGDKPVLMLGGPDLPPGSSRAVLEGYGFKHVYTAHDLHAYAPPSWPYADPKPEQEAALRRVDFSQVNFAAILVFHDSREWGRDIQLAVDILRSRDGIFGTVLTNEELKQRPPIPVFFSHADLLWGNEHNVARLGQRAFRIALEAVFNRVTDNAPFEAITFGKPENVTYEYAAGLLKNFAGSDPTVWMIGDNPASDIHGANDYGWSSALVRTGVFRDVEGPPAHKPTFIADNVEQAISEILKREWS